MRTAEIIGPRKNVEGAEKKKRDEGRARMIYEDKARVCVCVWPGRNAALFGLPNKKNYSIELEEKSTLLFIPRSRVMTVIKAGELCIAHHCRP